MKFNLRPVFLLAALSIGTCALAGNRGATTLEVYPGPGGNAYQSNLYTVEVLQGTTWLPSYVYQYGRTSVTFWHQGAVPTVNFTTFGTSASATVRVSRLAGSITCVTVSPKSKNFPVQLTAGQAILTLNSGDKAWITLNSDDANPLFVFASAPKPAVPAGATYFGPGVQDIAPALANHYTPFSGETIYLDGGAWVRGNIDVRGKRGVTIMGPGILSGDLWSAETVQASPTFGQMMGYAMITGDWGGTNATVQNITIVDSPVYNFYGGTHTVNDVKVLSPWYYSTDGFQGVNTIGQSFAFVGDNVFFPIWAGIANDDINVTNSFAATSNNAVFCGGFWGNPSNDHYHATVNNVDIRTYNSDAWVPYGAPLTPAVFQIWVDNSVPSNGYSNQTYENIRVEGNVSVPLAMLKNMPYPWGGASSYQAALGNSYNLLFQNISLSGTQKYMSEIKGFDSNNGFHNVAFQGLTIGGVAVTQSNYTQYFATNPYVTGLSFQ